MEAYIKNNLSRKGSHYRKRYTPSVSTIILPYDPIALVERLDILMASRAAGKTGVRNELISVCDELLRQNLIDKQKYKNKYVAIIKC